MPTPPTQLPPSRSSPTPPAQRPAGHTTAAVTTQTSAPSRATHGVHGQTFAAATGAGSKHRVSPPPDPKGKRPAFSSSAAPKARQGAEDAEDAEDQLFLGRRRLPVRLVPDFIYFHRRYSLASSKMTTIDQLRRSWTFPRWLVGFLASLRSKDRYPTPSPNDSMTCTRSSKQPTKVCNTCSSCATSL